MKSKVSSLYISLPHDHLHRTPDPLEKRINVAEILSKLGGIRSVGSDQGRGHTSYGILKHRPSARAIGTIDEGLELLNRALPFGFPHTEAGAFGPSWHKGVVPHPQLHVLLPEIIHVCGTHPRHHRPEALSSALVEFVMNDEEGR